MAQERREEDAIAEALNSTKMRDISIARQRSLIGFKDQLVEILAALERMPDKTPAELAHMQSFRHDLDVRLSYYKRAPPAPAGIDQSAFNMRWKERNKTEQSDLKTVLEQLDTLNRTILTKQIDALATQVDQLSEMISDSNTIDISLLLITAQTFN